MFNTPFWRFVLSIFLHIVARNLSTSSIGVLAETTASPIYLGRQLQIKPICKDLKRVWPTVEELRNTSKDQWPWLCLEENALKKTIVNESNIFEAAAKGYLGFVQYYAEELKVALYVRNEKGSTPLQQAVKYGHLGVVRYITFYIKNNSNSIIYQEIMNGIGKRDNFSKYYPAELEEWGAVMYAAYFGQEEIMKFFLEKMNADLSYDNDYKDDILRKVARSRNLSLMKYLVNERNYTVNQSDCHLLLWSATGGNVELIQFLLFKKNLTKIRCYSHWYPGDLAIHAAASEGRLEAIRFFIDVLNYGVEELSRDSAETPIFRAAEGGHFAVVEYLFEEKGANSYVTNSMGDTLLTPATRSGNLHLVKYLIEQQRLDPNVRVLYNRTLLHEAASLGHLDIVVYLLEETSVDDVNVRDYYGSTPLVSAVDTDQIDVVRYLVEKKNANINLVDNFNRTPAMYAARCGNLNILKFLIDERQANVTVKDQDGRDLLENAIYMNGILSRVVKYLVEEVGLRVGPCVTKKYT